MANTRALDWTFDRSGQILTLHAEFALGWRRAKKHFRFADRVRIDARGKIVSARCSLTKANQRFGNPRNALNPDVSWQAHFEADEHGYSDPPFFQTMTLVDGPFQCSFDGYECDVAMKLFDERGHLEAGWAGASSVKGGFEVWPAVLLRSDGHRTSRLLRFEVELAVRREALRLGPVDFEPSGRSLPGGAREIGAGRPGS